MIVLAGCFEVVCLNVIVYLFLVFVACFKIAGFCFSGLWAVGFVGIVCLVLLCLRWWVEY